MRYWCVLLCLFLVRTNAEDRMCGGGAQPVFRFNGDLQLAIIVNECSSSSLANTAVATSAWISQRFNVLNSFAGLKLAANIYQTCDTEDIIDSIVNVARNQKFNLGVVAWKEVPPKIKSLGSLLETPITVVEKQWQPLITATVGVLSAFQWNNNLTIITNEPDVLTLFYHESRKEWICVKSIKSFRDVNNPNFEDPTVVFGNEEEINSLLKNVSHSSVNKLIIVPLDETHFRDLPNGSYILQPTYAENQIFSKIPNIIPSSILLEIAVPLIKMAKNVSSIMENHCNQSNDHLKCLKHSNNDYLDFKVSYLDALQFLKIEPLREKFVYNLYKNEHLDFLSESNSSILQTFVKIGTYSLFNYTLIMDGTYNEDENVTVNETVKESCMQNHKLCIYQCLNFKLVYRGNENDDYLLYNIVLRQEPWVLAVLAIASLGVIFCVAILIFIFVRLCKKDIFEGNPVLSVLLLLNLTVMYASVVPFALEVTFESEFRSSLSNYLCLIRSLAVTLSYSCAFSLMLSRCVMLATVAYEAGFMSHITGHVQSLLCLFMIAVQGALSLQSVENCQDSLINSFLYILSYDILLLTLLLCSCPFIYRSQRNYKEGCYFTIAIILVVVFWVIWITAFVVVDDRWKMTVVCSGLLATASAILGAVFIPRTYLMTSAVVRDSLTSALPSLAFASSTSVLDLNYSNSQHVYDCVNIAAINANVAQTVPALLQTNPNFYSEEPNLETTEINLNSLPCDGSDKVTRF